MANDTLDLFGESVRPARAPDTYDIPPDALRDVCAGPNCHASIWWIEPPNAERLCVDVRDADCKRPVGKSPGVGRAHYPRCPDWKRFHRDKGV